MSKFFIDRPIFAWVIALVIMLAGILSILNLPINQYPNIAAPAVSIVLLSCSLRGRLRFVPAVSATHVGSLPYAPLWGQRGTSPTRSEGRP